MHPIVSAKLEYGNLFLYKKKTPLEGCAATFKILNYKEHKAYKELIGNNKLYYDLIEDIFVECIIEYFDDTVSYDLNRDGKDALRDMIEIIPAGNIMAITTYILSESGAMDLNSLNYTLHEAREIVPYSSEDKVLSIVSYLFKIPILELKEMQWPDIVNLSIQAEEILSGNIPSRFLFEALKEKAPTGYIDAEEENRKQRKFESG